MGQFIQAFLFYTARLVLYVAVALWGIYVGYRLKHRRLFYFKKQRKKVKKYGKLLAYLNRQYEAANKTFFLPIKKKKRDEKSLYNKCFDYAGKFELKEINNVKARLKKYLKGYEFFGIMCTFFVGMSPFLIYAYAFSLTTEIFKIDIFSSFTETQLFSNYERTIESILGCAILFLFWELLWNMSSYAKKNEYLISVLEDVADDKKHTQGKETITSR